MFEFRLHYFNSEGHGQGLRLSNGFRLVFLVLAVFIATAMIGAGQASAFGIALAIISLIGAMFDESWHWQTGGEVIEHRIGLLFLQHKKSFACTDILAIELRRFGQGKRHRLVRLNLEHATIGSLTLECHRHLPNDSLETAARKLAENLDKPLAELDD